MTKKHVCITGATGIVGQACLNSSLVSRFHIIPCSRQECCDYYTIRSLVDVPNGDVLLHLGEDSNITRINAKEWKDVESSYLDFCELVERKKFPQIIYLSSSVIENYHVETSANFVDSVKLPNYVRLKLLMEKKVISIGGSVIRVPNLYGTAIVKGTIIHDVCTQILMQGRYTLRRPEALIRFLHLQDLIDLLTLYIESNSREYVNLSHGAYYSADRVAAFLAHFFVKKGMLVSSQVCDSLEPAVFKGDPSYFSKWNEKYSLHEGLTELLESRDEH